MGTYYRPELHFGYAQKCRYGSFCVGGGSNQTRWLASPEASIKCPPGTWQNERESFGCFTCPEGVQCPEPGMDFPLRGTLGLVDWGKTGYDASQGLCPGGFMCLRPPHGKTPKTEDTLRRLGAGTEERELPEFMIPNAPGQLPDMMLPGEDINSAPFINSSAPGRRLRLPIIPPNVRMVACPAGYYCPPGTIADLSFKWSGEQVVEVITPINAVPCSIPGIICSEGAHIPTVTDVVAAPGQYINADKSGVISCPLGYYCPGGVGNGMPIPCPPGTYQATKGAPVCSTCTAGTICPGFGGHLPELCPAGRVCAHPGRMLPSYFCPAGSYCPPGVFTLNTLSGIFPGGPKICPQGTYCLQGTGSFIIDDIGLGTMRNCVEGTFCGANTTNPGGSDNCPPGWY